MVKTAAKRPAAKKKTARSKTTRGKKRVATARKKKAAVRKKAPAARKKKAAVRKKASPARKKKPAAKKPARKKAAVKKKTTPARKRKPVAKKPARKKAAKRGATKNLTAVQKQLEKRVDKLTAQLDEMRALVKKEIAEDLENTRKYADAEMAAQKRRFKKVLRKIKKENKELRSRLGKFVEEHELLKDVTKGVSDTAKSLEERVRKIVSGGT